MIDFKEQFIKTNQMALVDIRNLLHNLADEAKGSLKVQSRSIAKTIKRSREISPDSGTENEPHQIASPVKKMKKPSFVVRGKEMQAYFRLLGKWLS